MPASTDPLHAQVGGERSVTSEQVRAALLLRVMPALVHRLNNSLAVVMGLSELLIGESGEAEEELRTIRHESGEGAELLTALGRLLLDDDGPDQVVDPDGLLSAAERVLAPICKAGGTALEARRSLVEAAVRCGPRLPVLLLVAAAEALVRAPAPSPSVGSRRLRLFARAEPGGVVLGVAMVGAGADVEGLEELRALAVSRGLRAAERPGGRAWGFRFHVPSAGEPGRIAPRDRGPARTRILVADPDRRGGDLVGEVLSEAGHPVGVASGLDDLARLVEQGGWDLVLADPALGADAVRAQAGRLEGVRLVWIGEAPGAGEPALARPFGPGDLMGLVGGV
jgi:hypothetical protein